ncbi:MAG: C39 family peptidase [Clostridiales bacterium]|nr:C39 family peptidase [Clostridiales bacterium]
MRIEYLLCGIALLFALHMTGTAVSRVTYAVGEAARDARETESNEPEYVTFIRGVVRHVVEDDSGDEENEATAEDTGVDISQFADDDGYAGQVYALLEEYPDQVETILSYYENATLTVDGQQTTMGEQSGDAIPERLLQLVVNNVETIDFVADYPTKHDQDVDIDLSEEAKSEDVPLLLQWDERWGYEEYGDGLLCYTGCGPTCLSMVALYLTGDADITPLAVANYADQAGYYTDGTGSAWTLMSEGCEHFGVTAVEMYVSESGMAEQLEAGHPMICAVGAGDFTASGHFIVIYGYSDGAFLVNDPNSPTRSAQTWSYDTLSSQIKNIWYYSLSN